MERIGGAGYMTGKDLGRMTWHIGRNKLVRREREVGGIVAVKKNHGGRIRGMIILEEDLVVAS